MTDLTGQIISNRYQVESFLGKGGMAEVYKVWDQVRSVYLAMKVLYPDLAEDKVFIRRFRREAQTLAKLQHPNIVRFYGLERDGDLVYILMDYVDGTTLRKEIFRAEEPFSLQRILEIMQPICAALHYAHQSGYIHCDVKPANIMIHNNGTVLLSDFGIARLTEAATVTMVGAGTPAYMAPEQARGEDPSPQTDIYALGVVLFEMLTGGERPFTGERADTTGSTSEKIRWEQIRLAPPSIKQFNPNINPGLEEIVSKCLEKEPTDRYLTVMELLSALDRTSAGHRAGAYSSPPRLAQAEEESLPPTAVPIYTPAGLSRVEPVPTANSPRRNKTWGWIAALVGLFCVGVVLIGVALFGWTIIAKPIATSVPVSTSISLIASSPPPVPLPLDMLTPSFTPFPSDTPTPSFTSTPQQLFVPTIGLLPQQWNGVYTYPTGEKQNITLLIEKINGLTFTGKMIWQSFDRYRGAILRMNGEWVTDFGDSVERTKWNNLEDYRSGDRSGFWLKWTETEIIEGGNYTVNGWYYAHIRKDGTMMAVYFYNKDETIADIGKFVLKLVSP